MSDGSLRGYGNAGGGAWAKPSLLASDEYLVHIGWNDYAAPFGSWFGFTTTRGTFHEYFGRDVKGVYRNFHAPAGKHIVAMLVSFSGGHYWLDSVEFADIP